MPIFQEYGYLSLEPLQIEAQLKGALSLENIRINVPSVFTVGISKKPELVYFAAERLLGLDRSQIAHQAKDIIFGQMREVIAGMKVLTCHPLYVIEVRVCIDRRDQQIQREVCVWSEAQHREGIREDWIGTD